MRDLLLLIQLLVDLSFHNIISPELEDTLQLLLSCPTLSAVTAVPQQLLQEAHHRLLSSFTIPHHQRHTLKQRLTLTTLQLMQQSVIQKINNKIVTTRV